MAIADRIADEAEELTRVETLDPRDRPSEGSEVVSGGDAEHGRLVET
jgi:hypothetical protein